MLRLGQDYTVDRTGRWVFTASYLRGRGYCCFQGCLHCPWGLAGLGPVAARSVLRERLLSLQSRLRNAGLLLCIRGHHDGVLRLTSADGPPSPPSREKREQQSRQIQDLAGGLLHLRAVDWPGAGRVALRLPDAPDA